MLAIMISDRASSAILRAEREIRGQIGKAATGGEYELVARLSSIAHRLSELAEEAAGKPASAMPAVSSTIAEPTTMKSMPAKHRKSTSKGSYPRFEKTRDVLVKIGWSKKERSEYVHKAPKAGVDAVARRVMELGKGGQLFTTKELLPVKQSEGRDVLPDYQTYVCLAWFRDIGAVTQHGREGYSVTDDDVMGVVGRIWEALPASRR